MFVSSECDTSVSQSSDRFVLGELELIQPYSFATKKGNFQTFTIPEKLIGSSADHIALGKELIRAFRTDGLFQVEVNNSELKNVCRDAIAESKNFFWNTSLVEKRKLVNDLSYSGYIASGEEITGGEADGSEIFTITPDIALDDERIGNKWPCHGPGKMNI